ncbi:hypothetical protein DBR17_06920 [Sphingomonas sp. HMWF008]|nr:hypothetical protein DBR17_06920 [Sphingomonas sp. HMWF008]
MGTVLKVLGVLFIGYWLMVIVGCSMLVSAVNHAAKTAPHRSDGDRDSSEVARAMRDGRSDAADRIIREIEADRARERNAPSYDENAGPRPHFKPGEPMVDPNPSSRYDD